MAMDKGVEAIWTYTTLDGATVDEFEQFFKEEGFTVKYLEEFKDLEGHPHIIFNLLDNISKFAIYRLQRGADIKWLDDYAYNYCDTIPEWVVMKYDLKEEWEDGKENNQ